MYQLYRMIYPCGSMILYEILYESRWFVFERPAFIILMTRNELRHNCHTQKKVHSKIIFVHQEFTDVATSELASPEVTSSLLTCTLLVMLAVLECLQLKNTTGLLSSLAQMSLNLQFRIVDDLFFRDGIVTILLCCKKLVPFYPEVSKGGSLELQGASNRVIPLVFGKLIFKESWSQCSHRSYTGFEAFQIQTAQYCQS